MVSVLIFLPIAAAVTMLLARSQRWQFLTAVLLSGALGFIAILLFAGSQTQMLSLPHWSLTLIEAADIALLLLFFSQGFRFASKPVMALAALQLPLYLWALAAGPVTAAPPLLVDELSRWMFLIINIVGSLIVIYAVAYMRHEEMPAHRQRRFIAYLMLFLSVMNAIVIADDMLLFFFLFEMTTLASYLLIAFRGDDTARANALRALWMNQIGGVFLLLGTLVAVYGFGTATFSGLVTQQGAWLPLAVTLLALAAPVKGASLPFNGWLIGAMVAPTPVSAILHSATMVKIAPFLILKLAPALSHTLSGTLLTLYGALVFTGASYLALDRTYFKEILGYSTIALLGLMMSLAAIGTQQSMQLALALMVFHALSKALLFLAAGALEKLFGYKEITQMAGLVHCAPRIVALVLLGFVSLTLPPFGLFMGKLFAIASVASMMPAHPWLILVLLGIAVGSALLVMLYFKVAAALLSSPSDLVRCNRESLTYGFGTPMALLALLSIAAAVGYLLIQPGGQLWLFAVPLAAVVVLPMLLRAMNRFDRISPYQCGEKGNFDAALFYVSASKKSIRNLQWGAGLLFAAIALAGVFA